MCAAPKLSCIKESNGFPQRAFRWGSTGMAAVESEACGASSGKTCVTKSDADGWRLEPC